MSSGRLARARVGAVRSLRFARWRTAATGARESRMRIALAADHAGYLLKDELAAWLRDQGHDVSDLGTNGPESVDYPEFGRKLADAVASGQAERGIAICGSGIGISIAVNREPRCRCARVSEPLSAELAREHNDANVLALGARLIGSDMAKACVSAFLDTNFAGGRHQRRVDQLSHLLQDSD
jgi:ribose 5-phosphate isomerase B